MLRAIPTLESEWDMLKFIAEAASISAKDAVTAAHVIAIDDHIKDEKALWNRTSTDPGNFRLMHDALVRRMDGDPKSPLYWGKARCGKSGGRRCAMAPRHMLFMYLEYSRHGASQEHVAATYGISQTSASRYFAYVQKALAGFLPTADKSSDKMQEAKTPEEVQQVGEGLLRVFERAAGAEPGSAGRPGKTLPGNIVMHDGTHVSKERAVDRKERDASYSGKKKAYTNNVVLTTNRDGLILGMSGYAPGSTNDITLLRESGADLGLVTRCMEGKSSVMEILEYVDKGFRGLQKDHPGSTVMMPLARKKSGTKTAKAHSRRVNRVRVIMEHCMRWCKMYRRLRDRLRRTKGKMREAFVVITGLVNLHLLTGSRDPARTHRKGKKPGPKTARSRS